MGRFEKRPSDWNRAEYEVVGERTMTEVIHDAIARAEEGAKTDGVDLVEGDCPLCTIPYRVEDLPWHVGSRRCGRNLIDQAVMEAIGSQ